MSKIGILLVGALLFSLGCSQPSDIVLSNPASQASSSSSTAPTPAPTPAAAPAPTPAPVAPPTISSIQALQPALAVRGTACIHCHSNIGGNIVTDFGYGTNAYFYNTKNYPWNSDSVYGDDQAASDADPTGNWSMTKYSNSTIFVPTATLPTYVQSVKAFAGKLSTIEDYIKFMVNAPGSVAAKNPPPVKVMSNIYIGAPTDTQILAAFNANTSVHSVYLPTTGSTTLASLKEPNPNVFLIEGALTCDGDLLINGTLLISNLNLTSNTGCRVYATGTVFISGPINYTGAQANLQISSSRAISMGLGNFNSTCNADEATTLQEVTPGATDTVAARFRDTDGVGSYLTRDGVAPLVRGQQIVDDANNIRKIHILNDAICEPQGQAVAFSHLLLNAPDVQSRYQGRTIGAIIAEVYVGSLSGFIYQFDPIFNSVPALSKLDPKLILSAQ